MRAISIYFPKIVDFRRSNLAYSKSGVVIGHVFSSRVNLCFYLIQIDFDFRYDFRHDFRRVRVNTLILIDPNASEVASEDESEVDSSLEAFLWQFYVFMS